MKGKKISTIIILTSIALLGVIVTQSFWVISAYNLKRELLDQDVTVGVKRVVNQIMLLQNFEPDHKDCPNNKHPVMAHKQFIYSIEPALIDSMIAIEFQKIVPTQIVCFGIYEIETREFVICNDSTLKDQILQSHHKAPISCVYQADQFILAVLLPEQQQFLFNKMLFNILLSALFTIIIIVAFWLVIKMLLKQKKLSDMKSDFVNNMTHELKTPIATIMVASEMLMNENIQSEPEKALQYARIIHEENNRLRDQVDNVLQVAKLERSEFSLNFKELDANEVISQVIRKFEMPVINRGGTIHTRLNAANSIIWADKIHITNALQNLIDNAVKYSTEQPQITISTRSNAAGFSIQVEDQGIGIEPQNLQKIFLQFHRVSTGDVHNVKGFGIGLYYVKKIVEAHEGTIQVNSNSGKGSTFTMFLPFKKDELSKDEK